MRVEDTEPTTLDTEQVELEEFTAWFEKFLAEARDRQIEVVVCAQQFDELLQQAEWEFEARKHKPA